MKKRRKKKGGSSGPLLPCSRLLTPVESLSSSSSSSSLFFRPGFASSLNCLHCCTRYLDLLHESSSPRFDILAHLCRDFEAHVEELNTLRLRPPACFQRGRPFLQVSPLILHRQGFRPHQARAPAMLRSVHSAHPSCVPSPPKKVSKFDQTYLIRSCIYL